MMGTNGTQGVRNGRACPGFVWRNTITAMHTITKASSVPIFTILPISSIGVTLPTIAASVPTRIVFFHGVRNFGCTAAKNFLGNSPSLAIEYKTRVWPRSMTSITLVSPASAPSVMMCDAPVRPRSRNARATGASILISRQGTMPVSTAATAMYNTVQTSRDKMIPIGRSRCGFFASCAVVETASNPM